MTAQDQQDRALATKIDAAMRGRRHMTLDRLRRRRDLELRRIAEQELYDVRRDPENRVAIQQAGALARRAAWDDYYAEAGKVDR